MYCRNCGNKTEEDAVFCGKCGARITKNHAEGNEEGSFEEKQAEIERGSSKKKKAVVIIGAAVILVVCIAAVCILLRNNDKEIPDAQSLETDSGDTEKASEDQESEDDTEINEDEYIFPYSDTEYLTDEQVRVLSEEELGFARNEIFARLGRIYKGGEYEIYFNSKSWYKGTKDAEAFDANYENELNEVEKANVELIKRYEERYRVNGIISQHYSSVIKEYQEAEAGGFSGSSQYPNVNPLLFSGAVGSGPLQYTLIDLSGDGTPELFIGRLGEDRKEYTILDMYGYTEGGPALRFMNGLGAWPETISREIGVGERYYICENLMLKLMWSEESADYYQMEKNGVVMVYVEGEGVWSDGSYYYSDDGYSTMPVGKEEYDRVKNKYPVKTDMNWFKVSDYAVK